MKTAIYGKITQTKNGQESTILDVLEDIRNGKWQDICLNIMKEESKEKRDALKKNVPYFTPSGFFKHRSNSQLIQHSGFIGIDLDDLENVNASFRILCADQYSFAVFKSISGRGLCVLVKIEPDKHIDAFFGLQQYYFELLRHPIDPACKDVARARFISYDPHLHINEESKLFKKYLPKKKTKVHKPLNFIHTKTKFERVMSLVDRDITGDYHQWVSIGFAIASEYGENGEQYFTHLSSFSPEFDAKICERQYKYLVASDQRRKSGISIGTFYYYAKQAGIDFEDKQEEFIAKTAYFAKSGGRNKESVKKILEMNEVTPDDEIIDAVFQNKEYKPTVDENGKSELNIEEVEIWIKANYDIRKNEVTENYENEGVEMTEEDLNSIFIAAKKVFDKLSREIFNYIIFSNHTEKYNPIKNYINNIPYDQRDHIKTLCESITSDTGSFEFRYQMLKKWIVGIVEGIYSDNSNQLMLVLAGQKNTGKSWFFEKLLPKSINRYFVNGVITGDKDNLILLCNNILFFNDEFTNREADSNIMKQLLSAKSFDIRAPYGKKSVKRKKIASFCAATNETQILNDPTGNRRIIVFEIVGRFDFEKYNSVDKNQILAQALHLYESGMSSQLTHQEIERLEEITNAKYSETSIEAELLTEFVNHDTDYSSFYTTTKIKDYLETVTKQKLSVKKLGMELKRLGYDRIRNEKGIFGYKVELKSLIETSEKRDGLPF